MLLFPLSSIDASLILNPSKEISDMIVIFNSLNKGIR